jgi:hypothetical protein
VPQLSIRLDDSIASGDRVLRLLREIENEPGQDPSPIPDAEVE